MNQNFKCPSIHIAFIYCSLLHRHSRKSAMYVLKGHTKMKVKTVRHHWYWNWLTQQGSMTLKSLEVDKKDYKAVFKAWEHIFRPEANDTMTRFYFRNMKQKQGQSVDSFLGDLCLALPECQHGTASACEQLKDQFLFGVTIIGVQDNLPRTIRKNDKIEKCLHGASNVESITDMKETTWHS